MFNCKSLFLFSRTDYIHFFIQISHITTKKIQSPGTKSLSLHGNQPAKNLPESQLDVGIC